MDIVCHSVSEVDLSIWISFNAFFCLLFIFSLFQFPFRSSPSSHLYGWKIGVPRSDRPAYFMSVSLLWYLLSKSVVVIFIESRRLCRHCRCRRRYASKYRYIYTGELISFAAPICVHNSISYYTFLVFLLFFLLRFYFYFLYFCDGRRHTLQSN